MSQTDGYGQVIGSANETDYTNVKGVFQMAEVTRLQRKGKWPSNIYIGGQGSETFTAIGADTFTVPDNVSVIRAKIWGASGGSGSGVTTGQYSGGGGFTICDIAVTGGEVLDILIGEGGIAGRTSGGSGGIVATGGGGAGGSRNSGSALGGGGGGRSEIVRGVTKLAIAGGGGGGGTGSGSQAGSSGGNGGGTSGGAGTGGSAGGGGTSSAGGATTGSSGSQGVAGAINTGGAGGPIDGTSGSSPAGGGGGGYYGGGGGAAGNPGGAGGGGSGYANPTYTTNATLTAASGKTAGGSGDVDYLTPAGLGVDGVTSGVANAGNNGRIVITW